MFVRIHRVFSATVGPPTLSLEGDEAHHLGRVLRVRPGDTVEVFDGEGHAQRYTVEAIDRRRVALARAGDAPTPADLPAPLRVAVAAPKGKRAQRLVEGLTELGVTEIRFVQSARTEGKCPAPEQVRRWALEACKQCRRNQLPRVGPALSVDLLGDGEQGRWLVGDARDAQPVAAVVSRPEPTWVVVGPEGGLSPDELRGLVGRGATRVRLSPGVLRVETAAVGLCAAVIAGWEAAAEADPQ